MRSCHAIVVAAGSSQRMGFDKLSAKLACGMPVLAQSLSAFENCEDVDSITLVSAAGREDEFRSMAKNAGITKLAALVAGGAERHLSVWKGIQAAPAGAEFLAVHDAARPWILPAQISTVLSAAIQCGAAASARPITDTVKRADSGGQVIGSVEREGLWAMETPQIFRAKLLRQAYEAALEGGLSPTDEVSAVEALGEPVQLIASARPNPKVTFPADLQV